MLSSYKRQQPLISIPFGELILLLFAQPVHSKVVSDITKTNHYYDFSIGEMAGEYEDFYGYVNSYWACGGGISLTWEESRFSKLILGFRGNIGNVTTYNANPYFRIETRWLGIGLGLNILKSGSYRDYLPMFSCRLGPSDKFFIEGKLFDHSPGIIYALAGIIKLGLGIHPVKGSEAMTRIGLSDCGLYLHPFIPIIQHRLYLEPFIAYGSLFGTAYQFNITVYYRFHYLK